MYLTVSHLFPAHGTPAAQHWFMSFFFYLYMYIQGLYAVCGSILIMCKNIFNDILLYKCKGVLIIDLHPLIFLRNTCICSAFEDNNTIDRHE